MRATKLRYTSKLFCCYNFRSFHDLLVPSSPHSALFSHLPVGQCSLSRSAAPLPKNLASLCLLRFSGTLIDARYQTALHLEIFCCYNFRPLTKNSIYYYTFFSVKVKCFWGVSRKNFFFRLKAYVRQIENNKMPINLSFSPTILRRILTKCLNYGMIVTKAIFKRE